MNESNTKITANKQKKAKIIEEISAKGAKAKAMVFTNYTGLTHKQIEEFKRAIKKGNAEFAVTKNTLLKRYLTQASLETEDAKHFDLPTRPLFLYDDILTP